MTRFNEALEEVKRLVPYIITDEPDTHVQISNRLDLISLGRALEAMFDDMTRVNIIWGENGPANAVRISYRSGRIREIDTSVQPWKVYNLSLAPGYDQPVRVHENHWYTHWLPRTLPAINAEREKDGKSPWETPMCSKHVLHAYLELGGRIFLPQRDGEVPEYVLRIIAYGVARTWDEINPEPEAPAGWITLDE